MVLEPGEAHSEQLAGVIPGELGLVHDIPGQDGRLVAIQAARDGVVAHDDLPHVALHTGTDVLVLVELHQTALVVPLLRGRQWYRTTQNK